MTSRSCTTHQIFGEPCIACAYDQMFLDFWFKSHNSKCGNLTCTLCDLGFDLLLHRHETALADSGGFYD